MVVSATTIETEGGEECPEQGCSDQCRCDDGVGDDDSGGDGGEHFSDGSAENRNCRNANCNALIDIQALVPLASSKVKHHGHLQTSSPISCFENHWPVQVRVDPSLLCLPPLAAQLPCEGSYLCRRPADQLLKSGVLIVFVV